MTDQFEEFLAAFDDGLGNSDAEHQRLWGRTRRGTARLLYDELVGAIDDSGDREMELYYLYGATCHLCSKTMKFGAEYRHAAAALHLADHRARFPADALDEAEAERELLEHHSCYDWTDYREANPVDPFGCYARAFLAPEPLLRVIRALKGTEDVHAPFDEEQPSDAMRAFRDVVDACDDYHSFVEGEMGAESFQRVCDAGHPARIDRTLLRLRRVLVPARMTIVTSVSPVPSASGDNSDGIVRRRFKIDKNGS